MHLFNLNYLLHCSKLWDGYIVIVGRGAPSDTCSAVKQNKRNVNLSVPTFQILSCDSEVIVIYVILFPEQK